MRTTREGTLWILHQSSIKSVLYSMSKGQTYSSLLRIKTICTTRNHPRFVSQVVSCRHPVSVRFSLGEKANQLIIEKAPV